MSAHGKVVVVGAGLAGLACANRLHQDGADVLIVEGSDAVGGRVRTDEVDGFLLDRGFQVFLSAYPNAGRILDLAALDLRPFRPGAMIYLAGRLHRLMDVFRCPRHALSTAFQPIGTLRDKLLVGKLRWNARRRSVAAIEAGPDCTTEEFLRRFGFSEGMIDQFFRPFYGGIFLERDLRTSSRMFEFTFKMFAEGHATLPANGMAEIPRQLASRLPENAIRLNTRVKSVTQSSVTLEDGEEVRAGTVVVATDAETCGQLVPGSGGLERPWRSVSNLYFAAPASPLDEAIIALNGESGGLVNNVCAISDVAPGYAPAGQALLSVSVLGRPDPPGLEENVLRELRAWFGDGVTQWRHLHTDRIRRALPEQPPVPADTRGDDLAYRFHDGIFLCGDHCTSASIEGALLSGERTAEAILQTTAGDRAPNLP